MLKLHEIPNDLPFLPEKMKIRWVINIRILKQAQNHGLVLQKVHRVFKFQSESLVKILH